MQATEAQAAIALLQMGDYRWTVALGNTITGFSKQLTLIGSRGETIRATAILRGIEPVDEADAWEIFAELQLYSTITYTWKHSPEDSLTEIVRSALRVFHEDALRAVSNQPAFISIVTW